MKINMLRRFTKHDSSVRHFTKSIQVESFTHNRCETHYKKHSVHTIVQKSIYLNSYWYCLLHLYKGNILEKVILSNQTEISLTQIVFTAYSGKVCRTIN